MMNNAADKRFIELSTSLWKWEESNKTMIRECIVVYIERFEAFLAASPDIERAADNLHQLINIAKREAIESMQKRQTEANNE